ncbi:MAG: methyltransferase [Pseudoflavonifractor sp.]
MEQTEQLGPYRFVQPEQGFRLGQETLALAAFATLRPGWQVCDLGCGAAPLLLLLAAREPSLRLCGVELDPAAAELARRNLMENQLDGTVITGSFRVGQHLPAAGKCSLVVSNPPWFSSGSGKNGGSARMETDATLSELCRSAGYLLKNGGRFALVHRPERLCDLVECLRGSDMEPKRMQMIRHSPATPPSAVLLEAVRQGKPGLEVLPTAYSAEN